MATGQVGLETLDGLVFASHDFDGTLADTAVQVEGGHNVASAYETAVGGVLGDAALQQYRAQGGLRNRAPSDIIDQLVDNQSRSDRQQLTEDLVAAKLDCLTGQIGRRLPDGQYWPPLVPGAARYWTAVSDVPEVTTGINSSGHEPFIRRFYDMYDLAQPDIYVTDDDMRPLTELLPRAVTEKPSPLLLEIATQRWLRLIDFIGAEALSLGQLHAVMTKHVTFAGDGIDKDGELARRANVPFVHINPEYPELGYAELRSLITSKLLAGSHVES